MRGIFRLTRAEFNKIFKKPTVYIMALVLLLTCLITLFTLSPTSRKDERVTLSKDSAAANYSIFYSDTGSDNKNIYDKTILETDNIIEAFEENYKLNTNINVYFNEISTTYETLKTKNAANDNQKLLTTLKQNLNLLLNYFKTNEYFNTKEYYTLLINAQSLEDNLAYVDLQSNKLKNIYDKIVDVNDPNVVIELFDNNNYIQEIKNVCDYYKNYVVSILNNIVDDIKNEDLKYISYHEKVAGTTPTNVPQATQLQTLDNITKKINDYKSIINTITSKDNKIALISKENKNKLDAIIKRVIETTTLNNVDKENANKRQEVASKLKNDNYINQLYSLNKLLYIIDYSDKDILDQLLEYKEQAKENQSNLIDEIENLKDDSSLTRISTSITEYKLFSTTYNKLVNDEITQYIVKDLNDSNIKQLYSYDLTDYNEYNLKNNIIYNKYYLNNNIYSNSFLNSFEYNKNSEYETNVYDYIYSALKICTLLIIIFTMMMSAYLISSENDSGTIKLLLIRPYSRGKFLTAKMLATLFFSLTFLLLSIVITTIGGLVTFGLPAINQILVSFNASTIFVTSPIVLLLIYLLSAIFDIIFYLIISYFISVVFKSFAASISCSFITILLSIVLSIALPTSMAYLFIPFTNISLFRYFGPHSTSSSNFIETILSTPIQSQMNFWLSLIIVSLFSLILYLITYITFKRRDY